MFNRRFRPGLAPTLIILVTTPVLIRLGLWQLERVDSHQQRQQQLEQRRALPSLRLEARDSGREELLYRRVYVRGGFDGDHQLLIDNKEHPGEAGYHVLTPLKMVGSETHILVNRGWLPKAQTPAQAPDVAVAGQHVTIHGILFNMESGNHRDGGDSQTNGAWPAYYPWLDIKRYARETGFEVFPYVILMDADAPHGYVRDWGAPSTAPERYVRNARLWFAFAILLVFLYVVFGFWRPGATGQDK